MLHTRSCFGILWERAELKSLSRWSESWSSPGTWGGLVLCRLEDPSSSIFPDSILNDFTWNHSLGLLNELALLPCEVWTMNSQPWETRPGCHDP